MGVLKVLAACEQIPPLAHLVNRPQVRRRLTMRGGHRHFLRQVLRATLSGIEFASNCFSFAFASSSTFSRRASDRSTPPNLAFHLEEGRRAGVTARRWP